MPTAKSKRATVYLAPEIHEALCLKAATTERSLSDVINEAVRVFLAEDAQDLAALGDRAVEPTIPFKSFVRELKRSGAL